MRRRSDATRALRLGREGRILEPIPDHFEDFLDPLLDDVRDRRAGDDLRRLAARHRPSAQT